MEGGGNYILHSNLLTSARSEVKKLQLCTKAAITCWLVGPITCLMDGLLAWSTDEMMTGQKKTKYSKEILWQ